MTVNQPSERYGPAGQSTFPPSRLSDAFRHAARPGDRQHASDFDLRRRVAVLVIRLERLLADLDTGAGRGLRLEHDARRWLQACRRPWRPSAIFFMSRNAFVSVWAMICFGMVPRATTSRMLGHNRVTERRGSPEVDRTAEKSDGERGNRLDVLASNGKSI